MRHFISPPTLHQVGQLGSNLKEHGCVVVQAEDVYAVAGATGTDAIRAL